MDKSKGFQDLSISGIHVMRFSGEELQKLIQKHYYRPIATGGVEQYNPPKDQPFDKWADLWTNQEAKYLRRRV